MTIGIDASRAERPDKTGVEWYAHFIIQRLQKISPPNARVVLYSERTLPWPPRFLWTHARLSWEMLRRPPDVLFVPAHVLPIVHPRWSVVTIHDVAFRTHQKAYSWRARAYLNWSTRFAVRHASRIIVPTKAVKNDLINFFSARPSDVFVVPHAPTIPPLSPPFNEGGRLSGGIRPYFVAIGRNLIKKNIPRIREAFERAKQQSDVVRDMQLVHIGSDGQVPHEEVGRIIAGATALVFPSLAEGFGLPILDAMTLGVPVITSKGHATEEVAGGAALLVDPTDTEAIADAIVKIATDDQLRSDLIQKGLRRAQDFSWDKTARETYAILTSWSQT